MKQFKAIFFDMDGVLLDSEPCWVDAERAVFLKEFQVELTQEDLTHTCGLKTTEVVQYHCERQGINHFDIQGLNLAIEEAVKSCIAAKIKPIAGLYDLVNFLKIRQIPAYLVTSSSWNILNFVVSHLGLDDFFIQKFSAYDVALGKPSPLIYQKALQDTLLNPNDVLVIEDSVHGVTAAKSAGLHVLVRNSPQPRLAHFQELVYVLDHCEALDYIVSKNFFSHEQ
ncbi:MAG: HAD family phosphatase [Chitinophagales bacterium]|jgi:sugar-phosphatase|nr:HAD family phosphatase [Chitinophagales bacterium]